MGVVQNYNVGGWIDEIKKINFPAHLFPTFGRPFVKGFQLPIPAIKGIYSVEYICPVDMELVNVSLACSGYKDQDYWELITKEPNGTPYKVVETMPTRELSESINMGNVMYIVHKLPTGSSIRFNFHNESETSKIVWPSFRVLRP